MFTHKSKPTTKEVLKDSKRDISGALRGIEREVASLQAEEKKLVLEIKRAAKVGNQASTRVLAKEVVRIRSQITKLQSSSTHLRGISAKAQTAHANMSVAHAMAGASKAMGTVNSQMDPAKQMQDMANFQKASMQMDLSEEMLSDALDGTLDSDSIDDEVDDITNQVLDEIGISVASELKAAPPAQLPSARTQDLTSEDDLESRMAALKNC